MEKVMLYRDYHISPGIIPRPPYQPETQSRDDSRDDMENIMY
jgi:hypothetical protein